MTERDAVLARTRDEDALKYFREYVEANYRKGCILSDPQWHAPRWFRAALHAYQCAAEAASPPPPDTAEIEAAIDAFGYAYHDAYNTESVKLHKEAATLRAALLSLYTRGTRNG